MCRGMSCAPRQQAYLGQPITGEEKGDADAEAGEEEEEDQTDMSW